MGASRGHRIRAAVSAGHVATHGVWTRTTENCRAPRHSLKEVLDEVARQTCRPRTHWCVIRRPVDINGLRYVEHIIGYRFGEFAPLHTISRCTAPLIPPSPSVTPNVSMLNFQAGAHCSCCPRHTTLISKRSTKASPNYCAFSSREGLFPRRQTYGRAPFPAGSRPVGDRDRVLVCRSRSRDRPQCVVPDRRRRGCSDRCERIPSGDLLSPWLRSRAETANLIAAKAPGVPSSPRSRRVLQLSNHIF